MKYLSNLKTIQKKSNKRKQKKEKKHNAITKKSKNKNQNKRKKEKDRKKNILCVKVFVCIDSNQFEESYYFQRPYLCIHQSMLLLFGKNDLSKI